jgi:hypothetical protein
VSRSATDPGTKSGNFVPDHQPVPRPMDPPVAQQLYPYCIACSREQQQPAPPPNAPKPPATAAWQLKPPQHGAAKPSGGGAGQTAKNVIRGIGDAAWDAGPGLVGWGLGKLGCGSCEKTVQGWQDGLDKWGGGQKDAAATKGAYGVTSVATVFIPGGGWAKGARAAEKGLDLARAAEVGTGAEIRYYGDITPAAKPGEMVGRRLVREWDPATDTTRTWHETVDQSGNVRIVRPETGGPKVHYYFDEFGNYGGSW